MAVKGRCMLTVLVKLLYTVMATLECVLYNLSIILVFVIDF